MTHRKMNQLILKKENERTRLFRLFLHYACSIESVTGREGEIESKRCNNSKSRNVQHKIGGKKGKQSSNWGTKGLRELFS